MTAEAWGPQHTPAKQPAWQALVARLRSQVIARPAPDLPDISAARQLAADQDVLARFEAAGRAAGLVIERVQLRELAERLVSLAAQHRVMQLLMPLEPSDALSATVLDEIETAVRAARISPIRDIRDEQLFSVDAALTPVDWAIAETGTLVCTSGQRRLRSASLIPPLHFAVVGRAQIVPDLCDYFQESGGDENQPANENLISGPSKTADIEGILVKGVHGPRDVHVFVVD